MTHSSQAENPAIPGAYHLGDLARGGVTWKVYFETKTDTRPVKGRIHFVTEAGQRSTGWIFIEPAEQDLLRRFHEFSALELWRLLESLG